MGERCNRTAEVRGSIPLGSTNNLKHLTKIHLSANFAVHAGFTQQDGARRCTDVRRWWSGERSPFDRNGVGDGISMPKSSLSLLSPRLTCPLMASSTSHISITPASQELAPGPRVATFQGTSSARPTTSSELVTGWSKTHGLHLELDAQSGIAGHARDVVIDSAAQSLDVWSMHLVFGRRTGRISLAAMLLAALMLSLHGMLASLAMAATVASPLFDHRDCHGHADAVSFPAALIKTAGHADHEHATHTHELADEGSTSNTPSQDGIQHKPACCTPVGMALLPQLSSARDDRI